MTRIAQVSRADLALCIVSFHEQVLGCNSYITKARSSSGVVRGYQMLDRVLSAIAAAVVLPFDGNSAAVFNGLAALRLRVEPARAVKPTRT
jgi:tRNA(fMet)-specific endonuclease VapC